MTNQTLNKLKTLLIINWTYSFRTKWMRKLRSSNVKSNNRWLGKMILFKKQMKTKRVASQTSIQWMLEIKLIINKAVRMKSLMKKK